MAGIVFISLIPAILAQASKAPRFDVASVRANKSTDAPASRFPLGPGDAYVPGDLFSATNQPLIAYLRFAYKLGQGDLLNLPAWVYGDGFDIEARAQEGPSKDQMRLMMRSLLEERFGLRAHMEARTKPVLELTLVSPGKAGPMLVRSQAEGCAASQAPEPRLRLPTIPCGSVGPLPGTGSETGRLGGRGVTIKQMADIMENPFTELDRPVIDRTGLSGTFDFSLEWSTAPVRAEPPGASQQLGPEQEATGPGFREALQKQLGLKLVSGTGSVEVLVIDHLERPQEN